MWVRIDDPAIISIHTLHTEGDIRRLNMAIQTVISIHTLHTEGDIIVM